MRKLIYLVVDVLVAKSTFRRSPFYYWATGTISADLVLPRLISKTSIG